MAGHGPAPKQNRQRRNTPTRGEWIDLPELTEPVLPELPDEEWSERTQACWAAWRQDPATAMFAPGEIQFAIDLGYAHNEWVRKGGANQLREVRQLMDGLGLTSKGKQDRRWRVKELAEVVEHPSAKSRKLRAV